MARSARRDPQQWDVYGGPAIMNLPAPYGRGARIIVCAPSGAAARRAMAAYGWVCSRGDWAHSWCDTGNQLELAVARAAPEVPLYQPDGGGGYSWPRGVWLPLNWPIPTPNIPARAEGYAPTPCTSCGTSMDDCDVILFGQRGRGCCGACATTDTHNDPIDHPLHNERIQRNAAKARAR